MTDTPEAQRAQTPEEQARQLTIRFDEAIGAGTVPDQEAWIAQAIREARDAAYARGKEDGKVGERERLEAEHQDFRLQNDREWRAKVEYQKQEVNRLRTLNAEMLEALKAVNDDFRTYHDETGRGEDVVSAEVYDQLCTAIAKAEGTKE